MNVTGTVQGMIDELGEVLLDAEKHDKGQKAAGTRIRGAMQTFKTGAQELRLQVLADQKSR